MYKDLEKLLMTMLDDFRADQSNIELQRLLEEKQRNRERLKAWKVKVLKAAYCYNLTRGF
jgi:hypothetical protein